jgi:7-carboxy-7-deazaguanine synthase
MQISEIFYSIQGEGTRRGTPCTFVRLTGCPLRCRWCDTSYAFSGGSAMSLDEIFERVSAHPTRMVCVTGGEPLAQQEVHALMRTLADAGYTVLLETSGALDLSEVDPRVVRIVDLKAPGSGEEGRNLWSNLELLGEDDEIKFVLADRSDYEWARETMKRRDLASKVRALLFSPVHGELDPALLAAWILEDGLPVTLQLQLHKLLWPQATRGV